MGGFAGLFVGLFGSIAGFFATWVTKKAAFGAAAVVVFSALTVAFLAVLTASMTVLLEVGAVPDAVVFGMWYFMPSDLPLAVSAIIAAEIAGAIYAWNVENLRLIAYVT